MSTCDKVGRRGGNDNDQRSRRQASASCWHSTSTSAPTVDLEQLISQPCPRQGKQLIIPTPLPLRRGVYTTTLQSCVVELQETTTLALHERVQFDHEIIHQLNAKPQIKYTTLTISIFNLSSMAKHMDSLFCKYCTCSSLKISLKNTLKRNCLVITIL